jgi:hypothetical protein
MRHAQGLRWWGMQSEAEGFTMAKIAWSCDHVYRFILNLGTLYYLPCF